MLGAMSEANKLLAKQWFEQVWNQKSEAAIDRMFNPQGKAHGFMGPDGVLAGPEAFKEAHRVFCAAFPDIHIDLEDVIAEGDVVAIRWTATMTHLGDSLGFPATGKKGVLTGSSFIVVKENQIMDGWNQMDLQALFQKLQAK
jgi:predicted ester cyclase